MFKKLIMLAALLILTELPAYSESYPRINGIQIFVLDREYEEDLGIFFRGLKKEGYDTVFVRIFHNRADRYHYGDDSSGCDTGVYFKTGAACIVRDVMAEAVKAGKENGLKVYAWMATRSLSFLKTTDRMEKEFDGRETKDGYGFSIFNSDAAKNVKRLFADLAAYDIDGILFQDDFIFKHREGASELSLKAYERSTGIKISEDDIFGCSDGMKKTFVPGGCEDAFGDWSVWKNESMMSFFSGLKREVMRVNPDIRFAGNVYYETPLESVKGLSWYSQSISSMLAAGFDYLAVMGYHDQIAKELSLEQEESVDVLEKMIKNLMTAVPEKSRILFKVQRVSFDKERKVEKEDFYSICRLLDKYPEISRVTVPVNRLDDVKGICRNSK